MFDKYPSWIIILVAFLIIRLAQRIFATPTPPPIDDADSSVKNVSSHEEFSRLLKANTYAIVDFHATWCGPCHAIAPTFTKLADQWSVPGHLVFLKVDVDRLRSIASENAITAMPTFLFFENGMPYSGQSMIRGANPSRLKVVAEELGQLAKQKAAAEPKQGPTEKDEKLKEDTPTVSGGYTMSSNGARSDWKTSLSG